MQPNKPVQPGASLEVLEERIIIARYHDPVDDATFGDHLDDVSRAIAAVRGRFGLVVEINAMNSPVIRSLSSVFWERERDRLVQDLATACFVTRLQKARGFLAASKWLGHLPFPFEVFDALPDAVARCRQRLNAPPDAAGS